MLQGTEGGNVALGPLPSPSLSPGSKPWRTLPSPAEMPRQADTEAHPKQHHEPSQAPGLQATQAPLTLTAHACEDRQATEAETRRGQGDWEGGASMALSP